MLKQMYFSPQFEYTLTCAVCTKPHEKELKVMKKISQVGLPQMLVT